VANQSPDRREVLAMLAKIAAVGQFPGFVRWVHAEQTHERLNRYQPQFFTPEEYRTIEETTELIIPRDEGPGAKDAGVAEFIDFMVAHDDDIQFQFRTGLAWLDAFATEKYGGNFVALNADQQQALLKKLAYKDQYSPLEVQGQEFFKLLREYTVMGFYTSRIGLEQLDDPGLKFYSASPACPHKDDPEHLHLTGGQV
jgi:gluconate 2-dehydrogenase gamma chain